MEVSEKGLHLIKTFEGCRLLAYKPVAGETYWTIGWGHYGPDVKQGMIITQDEADRLLEQDVKAYANEVSKTCAYLKLNQNEFDALTSFTYNCGAGNLLKLTANKTRNRKEVAEHIEAYNKGAGGVVLAGLVKRRKAEKELFLTPDNSEKFEYLGINKFHKAGFLGQGITIASRESLSVHGTKVVDVLRQIVPEASVLYKLDYKTGNLGDVDVYTTSYFQSSDTTKGSMEAAKEAAEQDVFLCCAIGNDLEDITPLSKHDWWISVGACSLVDGAPTRMYFSGVGEELDFMMFTNLYTKGGLFTGTSCATPVFAAMVALVQCFFKEKAGRKLTNNEMLNFIKDNCVDMRDKGKDKYTGYGLFVLPDPKSIDVNKYLEEEEDMVKYQTLEELPDWAKPTMQKLVDNGLLKGNENGLDLNDTMVRMLVILDRAKVFDK